MGQNIIQVPKWPLSRRPRKQSSISSSERDFLRARGLTLCPDCNCKVRAKRLSKHKAKCPKGKHLIANPQPSADEPLYERYVRAVEDYNREYERLVQMRVEIDQLASQLQASQSPARSNINLGDRVKIIGGPFENFYGNALEVSEEMGVIKVSVILFNRPAAIDLDLGLVERCSNSENV